MPAAASASRWSARRRSASRPPWTRGMERLDPAVEHLREAGDRRDVRDREPGLAQGARRAAGADQLPAARDEAAGRASARPVLSDTDRRARRGTGAPASTARGSTRGASGAVGRADRAGEQGGDRRAAAAGARRDGCGRAASPRRRRAGPSTASCATIGPPSSVASTRWTVTPVTATPGGERVAGRVEPRERRQQRRVDVEDPACRTRRAPPGPTSRRYPASTTASGATARSVSASVASSPPGTSTVSIPCSAAQSSAGHARSANTRTTSPPSSPRCGGRVQRPQVGAGPRDADRDPAAHARASSTYRPPSSAGVDDLADDPGVDAAAARQVDGGRGRGGGHDEDHPEPRR